MLIETLAVTGGGFYVQEEKKSVLAEATAG